MGTFINCGFSIWERERVEYVRRAKITFQESNLFCVAFHAKHLIGGPTIVMCSTWYMRLCASQMSVGKYYSFLYRSYHENKVGSIKLDLSSEFQVCLWKHRLWPYVAHLKL